MIESELAHGEMPPLHVHPANESFHVFEGSLTVFLGEDVVPSKQARRLSRRPGLLTPTGPSRTRLAS